jgi:hypothetical protein
VDANEERAEALWKRCKWALCAQGGCMSRLRETLDEIPAAIETPTKFPTERNKYEMRCGVCHDLFYVDETTYNRVRRDIEFDPADNPFRCDDCEQEYDEEAVY